MYDSFRIYCRDEVSGARRGRKAAIGGLLVLLALPLWLTTLPAQEPDAEESRRIISHAEQQLDFSRRAIDGIERDFNSKLVERDNSAIPLVQRASEIASMARALADKLRQSTLVLDRTRVLAIVARTPARAGATRPTASRGARCCERSFRQARGTPERQGYRASDPERAHAELWRIV